MWLNSILRTNRFVRGIYFLYRDYFGCCKRSRFGFIADDVILMPPLRIDNPKNVFLYGDNGLRNADIMVKNARFVMKPHSGAAEGLRVTTGNHAMVVGRFYRTITEQEKPEGYDKDVVVESDVWIGRNVTLLCGITIGRGAIIDAGAVVNKNVYALGEAARFADVWAGWKASWYTFAAFALAVAILFWIFFPKTAANKKIEVDHKL